MIGIVNMFVNWKMFLNLFSFLKFSLIGSFKDEMFIGTEFETTIVQLIVRNTCITASANSFQICKIIENLRCVLN